MTQRLSWYPSQSPWDLPFLDTSFNKPLQKHPYLGNLLARHETQLPFIYQMCKVLQELFCPQWAPGSVDDRIDDHRSILVDSGSPFLLLQGVYKTSSPYLWPDRFFFTLIQNADQFILELDGILRRSAWLSPSGPRAARGPYLRLMSVQDSTEMSTCSRCPGGRYALAKLMILLHSSGFGKGSFHHRGFQNSISCWCNLSAVEACSMTSASMPSWRIHSPSNVMTWPSCALMGIICSSTLSDASRLQFVVNINMDLRLCSIATKNCGICSLLKVVYSSSRLFPSDFKDLVGVRLELGWDQVFSSSSMPRFEVPVVDVEVLKDGPAACCSWGFGRKFFRQSS